MHYSGFHKSCVELKIIESPSSFHFFAFLLKPIYKNPYKKIVNYFSNWFWQMEH